MSNSITNFLSILIPATIAWIVYAHERADSKRDAALLILQEIRFAESQVKKYNPNVGFQFYEKLLPTDSWNKNIHLFVNDFEESQIDAISLFYAKCSFLDEIITTISEAVLNSVHLPAPVVQQTPIGQQPVQPVKLPAVQLLDNIIFGLKMELIHNSAVGQRLRVLSTRKSWYSI